MTTFNEPSELERDSKATFSPDGKHFTIITSRGLVDSDTIQSTLWIYDTAVVLSFLKDRNLSSELRPRCLVTVTRVPLASTLNSYGSVISDLRWSPDSRLVYFREQDAAGSHLLYWVNAQGATTHRLTPFGYDVQRFDVAKSTVACTMTRPVDKTDKDRQLFGDFINEEARAVTGLPLATILFSQARSIREELKVTKLWISKNGLAGHMLSPKSGLQIDTGVVNMLSLSPSGHWAARLLPVNSIPASWAQYEPSPVLPYLRIDPRDPYRTSPRNVMRLKEYALTNLANGKTTFQVDAPNSRPLGLGIVDQAVWSPDERRLLMTNTFLPLEGVDEEERQLRIHACVVADVELSSLQVRCVAYSRIPRTNINETVDPPWLHSVAFGKDKNEVILRYNGLLGTIVERYQLHGEEWALAASSIGNGIAASDPPSVPLLAHRVAAGRLDVTIRQSLNSSPVLWATDRESGRSRQLWNPNPQLATMKLGQALIYHWKDKTGFEWIGDLIKPVDYVPGRRYPLVIQTHGFADNIFKIATDGAYPTAMAARPLASAGIMVLQVPDRPGKNLITSDEAERQAEGYVSAIAQLDIDGLIDPKRVGIIGFSRTCWYVETALIRFPRSFAAATIADGVDESYMQYHLFTGDPSWNGEFEKINQAKPFGERGLEKWMKLAPDFHLDKVETPLRIEAIGPTSILREWEIYSSLREQNKPVDLIYMPDGQHILQKPLDRLASEQGNVEWYQFWLQGCEKHGFSERSQYQRWKRLRGLRAIEKMPCTITPEEHQTRQEHRDISPP